MICSLCLAGQHHTHSMTPCTCDHADHEAAEALRRQMKGVVKSARRTDPPASHLAADSVTGKTYQEGLIWSSLLTLGERGGTCYEIARASGTLDHVKVDRSLKVLCEKGWVKRLDEMRPGDAGRLCHVHVALRPEYDHPVILSRALPTV